MSDNGQPTACLASPTDGAGICVMESGHYGPHGWEDADFDTGFNHGYAKGWQDGFDSGLEEAAEYEEGFGDG